MLAGLMMDTQLTTNALMAFAEKVHPRSEIVSITASQGLHRYTFAEAFQRTRQLANALRASGVEQGDRVGTLAWNDYRHLELYYGISGIGAVCHTINPRLFPEQIEYIINHADDKLLFIDPQFIPLLESLSERLTGVEQIVVLGEDDDLPVTAINNLVSYESYIGGHSDYFSWPELDERSASSMCYTSGTTGNPKGVLYSHRSTIMHAYAAALPDAMNLSIRDVVLPIVPMFHANAWGMAYAAIMVGSKLVLPGPKMGDGETLLQLINSEGVTLSAGVPTVWLALLNYLKSSEQKLQTLQRVIVGGAACPRSIMDEFIDLHGVDVMIAWGMTETSPIGTVNSVIPGMESLSTEEFRATRLKQGRPVFGVDLKIIGDAGEEQPWDGKASGEVHVRGPWICNGYYKLDNVDAHDSDGWFRTGDIATVDSNGFMKITDRTKDVIKSGGEWISSIDLENAAVGHPDVHEAAVIGIEHPKWTERPLLIAIKVPGAQLDGQQLLEWLEGKIAKWWIPDAVVFVEELPHTATGKLSKKDLRQQFQDYQFPGSQ